MINEGCNWKATNKSVTSYKKKQIYTKQNINLMTTISSINNFKFFNLAIFNVNFKFSIKDEQLQK